MKVSVVIPAYNASATIAETLTSLQAQTVPHWEAIVVDDGSSDETLAIAAHLAAQDRRIHTISQPQGGEATARNTGISLARYDWLLFLDADDWLLPQHLERLIGILASDPSLDAVHCGWSRIAPDGKSIVEKVGPQPPETFVVSTQYCPFAIHACIVRRSLLQTVEGFDTLLRTCSDWDFWQRIARSGARFGMVPEVLACYRMRPNSAGVNGPQLLADGLLVIERGHAPDLRVLCPAPAYVDGLPKEQLSKARLHFVCWTAGLVLGRGEDARPLLNAVKEDREPSLDAEHVAQRLFEAVLLSACRPPEDWIELWPCLTQSINAFLVALEAQSLARGLARRVQTILERSIVQHATALRPLTVGRTHAVCIEVTEVIPDLFLPATVERLACSIELERERIGALELPICEGHIPAYVLTDTIAAEFAWSIIGRFFAHTIYPHLRIESGPTGISLYRGDLCLAEGIVEEREKEKCWQHVHNRIGWTVFLQEIWGRPDWTSEQFNDPRPTGESAPQRQAHDAWFLVEVSEELPDIEVVGQELDIVPTIGGVPLGIITIPVERDIIHAQQLRAAIVSAGGYELCRAAVREGLLGGPITGLRSLRGHLAAAAMIMRSTGSVRPSEEIPNFILAPGWTSTVGRLLSPGVRGVILGRRAYGAIGTSSSRRVVFPATTIRELIDTASSTGEPIIQVLQEGEQPERVVYAPDVLWLPAQGAQIAPQEGDDSGAASPLRTSYQSYLNARVVIQPNSWRYSSLYEETKCEQALSLLPSDWIMRAFELTSAESPFSTRLASRVGSLTVAYLSQSVVDRSTERCTSLLDVRFMCLDPFSDSLPGCFDLIVCRDVLHYFDRQGAFVPIVHKIVDALVPGGYLLSMHENLVVDEPDRTGFDWDFPCGAKIIGETFMDTHLLRLVKEIQTPLYRIQLFQRDSSDSALAPGCTPEVTDLALPSPLPPELAAHVLWHGGSPGHSSASQGLFTVQLPILMYHRVAPTGSSATAHYQVIPEAFEEQLRYLRDAGFYSVRLEDWLTAMFTQTPLPGRAVLLTFDDGYLDFSIHAWPLLQRYGFSAIVFLVTDEIGGSNRWDRVYGEEVPLLGWKEIHRLQAEGVEFGSHSASHPRLTALPVAEVVREGSRSRAVLERRLHVPITAFAYPHGAEDRAVQHLIGGCGYILGLSTRPGFSTFHDPCLSLPRVEVAGADRLQDFIAKLKS